MARGKRYFDRDSKHETSRHYLGIIQKVRPSITVSNLPSSAYARSHSACWVGNILPAVQACTAGWPTPRLAGAELPYFVDGIQEKNGRSFWTIPKCPTERARVRRHGEGCLPSPYSSLDTLILKTKQARKRAICPNRARESNPATPRVPTLLELQVVKLGSSQCRSIKCTYERGAQTATHRKSKIAGGEAAGRPAAPPNREKQGFSADPKIFIRPNKSTPKLTHIAGSHRAKHAYERRHSALSREALTTL